MAACGVIEFAHLNNLPEYQDLIQQIVIMIRDPRWTCSLHFVYEARNRIAIYPAILGGELFSRLYIFYEPIGNMVQLMDLDMELDPHDEQILKAPMELEEEEVFNVAMAEGWAELADAFIQNLGINNDDIIDQDVVAEAELGKDPVSNVEDDDDLFNLF